MANKTSLTKSVDEALKCKTAEELIDYIQRKLGHGQYIYRGVPQKYKWEGQADISSSIFIEYRGKKGKPSKVFDGDLRPVNVEYNVILRAKQHFPDSMTNREILTNIRHFGGLTTLIDFSHDLMVALFFACYGDLNKHGQLIALEHSETKFSKHPYFSKDFNEVNHLPEGIEFVEPAITTPTSSARVIAQKSVFVHAPDGFIAPEICTIFSIPHNLKTEILAYLKRFHHIDQKTIYNDMHGFIALENRFATAQGHALVGNVLFEQEKYKDAEKEYTKAITQKPDFAEVYYNRGATKFCLKQFEGATKDFTETIHLKPDYAEAYFHRGAAKMKTKQFKEAIKDFTDAIRLKPDYTEAYYLRGAANVQLEQFDDAIKNFTDTLKLDSDYTEAYYLRGRANMKMEQFDDAIKDFTDAIKLKPDFVEAYHHRAGTNIELKKFKEAIDDSTVVIKLKRDFFEAYCNRGGAKLKLEKFKEAIKDFTEAIRLKSDYTPAYVARALAWEAIGNNKKAKKDSAKVKELEAKQKSRVGVLFLQEIVFSPPKRIFH